MNGNASKKRKIDSDHDASKRLKLTTASGSSQAVNVTPTNGQPKPANSVAHVAGADDSGRATETQTPQADSRTPAPRRRRINKLAPPRPFPTVPTSVSATGPRSAHKEGKNIICVTRKTALGAYMRRCKDVILKDGYKTLHFSAMGAAIPLLLQLVMALPPILPFSRDEIHAEVTTGTVEVQDEVIPDDEDEDVTYETRGKSTLRVVLKIGDGEFDGDKTGASKKKVRHRGGNAGGKGHKVPGAHDKGKAVQSGLGDIVLQEPEQEDMEML
ncbi:hypothetical protein LshimejAT787_0210290 [Lyophyllum shimeji]|uniref:Uncharacterized protein n=1 Tax=Lyophyllum shimeji TaxID=47721 RepID=A0A9P3PHA1_LYOSH|nr:hypothetical protein LshimejAT787_0210290 [Lyophyllum shimeji]